MVRKGWISLPHAPHRYEYYVQGRVGQPFPKFPLNENIMLRERKALIKTESTNQESNHPNLEKLPSKCWIFWVLMGSTTNTNKNNPTSKLLTTSIIGISQEILLKTNQNIYNM
jgi:hypothetical protein